MRDVANNMRFEPQMTGCMIHTFKGEACQSVRIYSWFYPVPSCTLFLVVSCIYSWFLSSACSCTFFFVRIVYFLLRPHSLPP
jgi:hypothetical protein